MSIFFLGYKGGVVQGLNVFHNCFINDVICDCLTLHMRNFQEGWEKAFFHNNGKEYKKEQTEDKKEE